MMQLINVVLAVVIATLFVAPALYRPTLGRVVLSAMFVGGALFNLLYTLPKTPGSLVALRRNRTRPALPRSCQRRRRLECHIDVEVEPRRAARTPTTEELEGTHD